MSSSLPEPSTKSFESLGLSDELLKAVAEQGYTEPSPIQCEAIVEVLKKRDVMAVARTGTGKTAGFTLPMVQLLSADSLNSDEQRSALRGLVITPTRELAAQVAQSVENYAKFTNIRSHAVFGGVRIEPQIAQLKEGLDILVATPGRLIDLYNQNAVSFDHLEILVLDEADRMLDLGFIDDIEHIQSLIPKMELKREAQQVQTLMFSATFSQEIKSLAQGMLDNPKLIEVTEANSTVDTVKQQFYSVDQARKSAVLVYLIKKHRWRQVLVFSRTKQGADNLVVELENAGIHAASIHANRTQHARTQALDGFKSGKITVLVATDIASRGIDVNQLACVVNFDLPYIAEDYVHRIGRTGRAGQSGLAVSLFSEDELKQLESIERLIGVKFESEIIPGFEPSQNDGQNLSPNKSQNKGKNKSRKAPKNKAADDDYGHFEADPKPQGKGKSKGRGSRGGKTSKPNSNDWKKMWP